MKKLLLLLFVGLSFVGCSKKEQKINVRWATYNIRMDTKADSLNAWSYRRDRACQWIKDNQIDIFGAQEVLHNQFEDILERLPNFKGLGVGREDGKQKGEYSAVFYNADKYDALDSNTFWLSETPDSIGKKGWDAALPRVVTWGKLKDKKTGKIFMAVYIRTTNIFTAYEKSATTPPLSGSTAPSAPRPTTAPSPRTCASPN